MALIPVKDVNTGKDVVSLLGWAGASGYITLVLGAIGATAEYRHRTIVPTLLIAPHRLKVLTAQVVTYLLVSLGIALMSILIVTALVAMRTGFHGISTDLLVNSYLGNAVYIVLSTLLGLGLGTFIKNQAATIAAIFVLFMAVGHIMPVLNADLAKYTLDSIGTSLSGGGVSLPKEKGAPTVKILSATNAGLVYLVYAVVPLAVGAARLQKNDIA